MFKVHLPYGFSSIKLIAVTATGAKFGPPGYEVNLLYIACLAALIIGGAGPFAIDGLIGKRFDARTRTSRIHPSVLHNRRFLTCRECGWVHYVMTTEEKAASDRLIERYQLSEAERLIYESAFR